MAGRDHGRPRGRGRGGRDARSERASFKRERVPAPREAESDPEEEPERPIKRQKLPELKLPKSSRIGDAEDGEIEWLEYMLRKEKKKDEDGLEDGLDGRSILE